MPNLTFTNTGYLFVNTGPIIPSEMFRRENYAASYYLATHVALLAFDLAAVQKLCATHAAYTYELSFKVCTHSKSQVENNNAIHKRRFSSPDPKCCCWNIFKNHTTPHPSNQPQTRPRTNIRTYICGHTLVARKKAAGAIHPHGKYSLLRVDRSLGIYEVVGDILRDKLFVGGGCIQCRLLGRLDLLLLLLRRFLVDRNHLQYTVTAYRRRDYDTCGEGAQQSTPRTTRRKAERPGNARRRWDRCRCRGTRRRV